MEELLNQINETFDNCMENASEETKLQLKIIRGNINTIITNHIGSDNAEPIAVVNTDEVRDLPNNGKRVLIVDDSSIVRNYLQKILSVDYQIDVATDGQDAIQILDSVNDSEDLSLILLDLMMPNVDGFGVLEYMNNRALKIPVIVITGDTSQDTITRAFNYRVVDMIEKPFDSKTILTKIQNVI